MANKSASSSDKTLNLILAVIIIAVLAAGGYTIYSKISDNMFDKAVADGTAPQTVATLARQAGESVDEFLEENGITDGSVNGDTTTQDFYDHMTVDRFAAYNGQAYDEFVSQYGLTDKVNESTLWSEAQNLIPTGTYIGLDPTSEDSAAQFDGFKQQFGLGADITMDTPWGEVKDVVNAANEAMANATEAPAQDAAENAAEAQTQE